MFIPTVRTGIFYDVASDAAAAAAAGQPNGDKDGAGNEQNGSFVFDAGKAFEGLATENLTWLQKAQLDKDPKALAKHAYEQEKLVGASVRVPTDKSTPEERDAFLNKLGRPEKADGYQLTVPKDMPKDMPYDGEQAKAFTGLAHQLGLTQAQAAGLHDWFVQGQVTAFNGVTAQGAVKVAERATKAKADLEKLWGPLDGDTATANLEIADKVFNQAKGGQEFLAALTEAGFLGPNKVILDARIAPFIAGIGTALYTEDGVLRGRPDSVGNPFQDGESFNLTETMKIVKEDPDRARSLIAAAGKKPVDFGLKA